MFRVINKQILAENIKRLDVDVPDIASKARPGQFVIVTATERSERVPLSIIETDPRRGTIALIFHESGFSLRQLGDIPIGEHVFSMLGPLGKPATIGKVGQVVCVATGIGAAQILPVCRAFKEAGNKVIGVIGAKTKKRLMLEAQMRLSCHKIYITTEDGSYEKRGLATDMVRQILGTEEIDLIYAIGSVEMMKEVVRMGSEKNIQVLVNLNPVMLDGTGMCGSCRVKVGGESVLVCVDGPEFDGNAVDFNDLNLRTNAFKGIEQWDKHPSQFNPVKSGSGILTKFLSAIRKQ